MPRGRPRKVVEEVIQSNAVAVVDAPTVKEPKKLEPLSEGQKYFEAPNGEIVIGDADREHVLWYDKSTGERVLINPRR